MIGIICAMQIEADGILALAQNTREETINDLRFISGTLNGKEIVTVVCGVGKVNAAMCAVTLINRYAPELVINSGVAGALSPLVSIGDMVIATKTVEHDMNTTALGDKQGGDAAGASSRQPSPRRTGPARPPVTCRSCP